MSNSSAICIDAGLVVRLFAPPSDVNIRQQWLRWQQEGRQLVAPILLRYEVTNAFHRYTKAGMLSAGTVTQSLNAALTLPIRLYHDMDIHTQALAIANRFSLPATYDAHYLALAERLGIEFWTTDQRLMNSVSGAFPWIHLVGS